MKAIVLFVLLSTITAIRDLSYFNPNLFELELPDLDALFSVDDTNEKSLSEYLEILNGVKAQLQEKIGENIVLMEVFSGTTEYGLGNTYNMHILINDKEYECWVQEDYLNGGMNVTYLSQKMQLLGGWSAFNEPDQFIISHLSLIKDLIEGETGKKVATFVVSKVRSKATDRIIYELKSLINGQEAYVTIEESLEGEVHLQHVDEFEGESLIAPEPDIINLINITGGFSDWMKADDFLKEMMEKLVPLIVAFTGVDIKSYEGLQYQKQTVAGYNYKIKAKINEKEVLVEVFESLTGSLEVMSCEAYPEIIEHQMITGGWTELASPTKEVEALSPKVKEALYNLKKTEIMSFTIQKFKKQVVAGTNYVFIAKVNGIIIEIAAFEDLSGVVTISEADDYPAIVKVEPVLTVPATPDEVLTEEAQPEENTSPVVIEPDIVPILVPEPEPEIIVEPEPEIIVEPIITPVVGQWTDWVQGPSETMSLLTDFLKGEIEKMRNVKIKSFEILRHKSQTVNGIKYKVEAKINDKVVNFYYIEDHMFEITLTSCEEYPEIPDEIPRNWSEIKTPSIGMMVMAKQFQALLQEFNKKTIETFKLVQYQYEQVADGYDYKVVALINGVQTVFVVKRDTQRKLTILSSGDFPNAANLN